MENNPIFAKFDEALGKTTPTSFNAPIQTRANEIRNIAQQAQADKQTQEQNAKFDSSAKLSNAPRNTVISIGKDVVKSVNDRSTNITDTAKDVAKTFDDPNKNIVEKSLKGLSGAGHVAGNVAGVVTDAIGNIISHIAPEPVKSSLGDYVNWMGEQINKIPGTTDKLNWINKFMDENPDVPKSISDVINTVSLLGGEKTKLPENTSPKVPIKDAMTKNSMPEVPVNQAQQDLPKIKEMITPKPTIKEAKLATDEGRLVKGNKPTLFKSGTPDKIATSDQQLKSSMTIQRLIPDAAKMDEPTLYSSLDSKISETASALKPEMEATPIKPETVSKITDSWENLKKSQIESADAIEEPNILKSQKQFESRLKKSASGNMNDLWETAKEYDASVPDNVKQANSMSSESLQNKKTIWLQNRAILRDAINDSESGLGTKSKQAFSDMRDMYEAQNGIMSKAKIETKVKPSKIRQAYDSKPGKVIRTVTKVGVGLEGIKKLTGL